MRMESKNGKMDDGCRVYIGNRRRVDDDDDKD